MSQTDIFWAKNIGILFENDKLIDFLPNNEMTFDEKLNAIVRFSLYLSILLILLKKDYLYFYIFIFVLIVTYFIHILDQDENDENSKEKENLMKVKNKKIRTI